MRRRAGNRCNNQAREDGRRRIGHLQGPGSRQRKEPDGDSHGEADQNHHQRGPQGPHGAVPHPGQHVASASISTEGK